MGTIVGLRRLALVSLACISLFATTANSGLPPAEANLTFDKLYKYATAAYTGERWYECVAFVKRSLEDYNHYKSTLLLCRRQCNRIAPLDPFEFIPLAKDDANEGAMPMPNHSDKLRVRERKFWERMTQSALCLARCRHDRFTIRNQQPPDPAVERDFQDLKPYSYLQLCYWKLEDLEHAVSATYTFLLKNPDDLMMKQNMEYYMRQRAFNHGMLKNLEEQQYQNVYAQGMLAYDREHFSEVIEIFERALKLYLEADQDCRLMCESELGKPGSGLGATPVALAHLSEVSHSEFYVSIADQYASLLRCKANCTTKLGHLNGKPVPDFLPSYYNYLQFAYFKERMVRKACEAVGSFLILHPNEENMLFNKQFYVDEYHLTEQEFKPREEAMAYHTRRTHETKLLDFISDRFKFEDGDFPSEHADDYRIFADEDAFISFDGSLDSDDQRSQRSKLQERTDPNARRSRRNGDTGVLTPPPTTTTYSSYQREFVDEMPANRRRPGNGNSGFTSYPPGSIPTPGLDDAFANWQPAKEHLDRLSRTKGIVIREKEWDLNGTFRFVAQNVLTPDDCRVLMALSQEFAEKGHGYHGKTSPHTHYEIFSGLSAARAVELAEEGLVAIDVAKTYFDKSEVARDVVETYFNLSSHLYFDYTHLVCREARPGADELVRTDLSHPVHGDNCVLIDGECKKRPPAFTWRDYSSVVYLNDDFEGGEFIFTDAHQNVQATVRPKCGDMVAFVGETPHGVKAVLKGTRCVLAQWMTLDPKHQEQERIQAQQALAQLEIMQAKLIPDLFLPTKIFHEDL